MTPDRLMEAQRIFLAASEARGTDRSAILDRECGSDEALRAEVESLLAFDDGDPDQVLSRPLVPPSSVSMPSRPALTPGRTIGAYTVIRQLGEGGMGAVFLAEQERPRRTVALKIIRAGMASPAMLRRMELEAELLGRLQHPGIAHIYEAGRADDELGPRPFFAMEFIDGLPLNRYADERGLGSRERLSLVLRVCEAVDHAHRKGVIHRDLKPSNILVDASGQPKVLDFGVARADDAHAESLHTSAGQLIGTLPYMSPEQVSGDPNEVDTRSDVYALGVILYQLLSGRLPHQIDSHSIPDAARMIREEEAPMLGTLRRELRGDIETIVARAMDKDRERRYPSAEALGSEIRRYLSGAPIEAKRDSAIYVLRKQLRRYRTLVAGVCLLIIGLSLFSIFAWNEARRRGSLIEEAQTARDAAQSLAGIADSARAKAEEQSENLRRADYFNRIGFAQAAFAAGDIDRMGRLLDGCPKAMRGWEWDYLNRISDASAATLAFSQQSLAPAFATVAQGRLMYFKVNEGIEICDAATKKRVRSIAAPPSTNYAVMSRDGTRVYVATGSKLFAWETALGVPTLETDIGPCLFVGDISADGSRILVVNRTDFVDVRAASDGHLVSRANVGKYLNAVTFSPDGSLFATCSETGRAGVYRTEDGARVRLLPVQTMAVRSIAFDPLGLHVATGGADGVVRVWDVASGDAPLIQGHVHTNKVTALAFSPTGEFIASGSTDTTVKVIEARTCEVVRTFAGHTNTITSLSFLDSHTILSAARDGTVRWWDTSPSVDDLAYTEKSTIFSAAMTRDQKRIYGIGMPGGIREWDASSLRLIRTLESPRTLGMDLELSSDESVAYTAMRDGAVRNWDLKSGKVLREYPRHTGSANDVAICERRGWLISGGDDGVAHVCDLATGGTIKELGTHPGGILGVDCSADGRLILTAGRDHIVRVWSGDTFEELTKLVGHTNFVTSVALSHDGTKVAASSEDGIVTVWPIRPGPPIEPSQSMIGHKSATYCVAFSADDTRLLSGGFDNNVRLWDVASGAELLTLRGHISSVHAVAFSSDGNRIMSADDAGGLHVWNARSVRK